MKKIMVCLPSGDQVATDYCISLFGLTIPPNMAVSFVNARTSIIEQSRFVLVKEALRHEIDYLFLTDSDISFPHDALIRLLEHQKDVVGATYVRRREPHNVLGFTFDNAEIAPGQTGLARMARMPLGFMLISSKVFNTIPKPWFNCEYDVEHDYWISEDYVFSDSVIKAGFDIWCDLDLSHELKHCGSDVWEWTKATNEDDRFIQ